MKKSNYIENHRIYWDSYELAFHENTRLGYNDKPKGGTFLYKGKYKPLSVCKTYENNNYIKLYVPDINGLRKNDKPFTNIVERRKSHRNFSDEVITLKEIGSLLYRSARIKSVYKKGFSEAISKRPYPGAGGNYELEVYLVANKNIEINSGIYHYDSCRHALVNLNASKKYRNLLIEDSKLAAGSDEPPLLICITCRKKKISWKYESIGYSLALKDAGILMYNIHLVSTAMNLGSCILGCGNSVIFSQATQIDPLEEPTIGELVIGHI